MGEFELANIFSDNMVLQRGKKIRFFGTAPNGFPVTVCLNGLETTVIPEGGVWTAELPEAETVFSCELTVSCNGSKIIIKNVSVGEVWLAGGQSNMEFNLKFDDEAIDVIPDVENPYIRFYDCPKVSYDGEEETENFINRGFWKVCNPENNPDFSAVGFYFAQKIFEKYNVPVGIIGCNMSGTTASAWLDEKYLAQDKDLNVYLTEYREVTENLDMDEYEKEFRESRAVCSDPQYLLMINGLFAMSFFTKEEMEKAYIEPLRTTLRTVMGPKCPNRPSGLYHNMVKKIAGYSVRGVIWYQGESDANKARIYGKLFTALINCWREAWKDELPFLFVQLAPFFKWFNDEGKNFPIIREQQEFVSKTVANAYMTSIMDLGMKYDIHPKKKRPVGERLALLAKCKVYGENILCEPPEVENAKREGNSIIIKFRNAGENLALKGEKIEGLEIRSNEQEISAFDTVITKDTIIINSDEIVEKETVEICFAWKDYLAVNLYNSADIPLKPFRIIV